MATEKQVEANRLNAQKSTGPKTPEGKATVSMNSLSHGLRARSTVLPSEDKEQFEELCAELVAEWQPQSTTELALLEKMSIAQWKLARAEIRESQILSEYPFDRRDVMLEALAKFQERQERGYFRALRELENLQKLRRQLAAAAIKPGKEAPAAPAPATDPIAPEETPDTPSPEYVMSANTTPSGPETPS